MTSIEINMALDELGGRLLSNQGPPTRADAVRLINALRQMRAENERLQIEVSHLRKHISRDTTCDICETAIRDLSQGSKSGL